ncbi:hypothetical protein ACFPRL_24220 [Pseudoclavibacter helvolus]
MAVPIVRSQGPNITMPMNTRTQVMFVSGLSAAMAKTGATKLASALKMAIPTMRTQVVMRSATSAPERCVADCWAGSILLATASSAGSDVPPSLRPAVLMARP